MASATRKKQLRRQANEKKGKTTRSYTWKKTNRFGGPTPKKAKPPRTKKQFKEQYEKDQITIQELQAQIKAMKEEQTKATGEQIVAQVVSKNVALAASRTAKEQGEEIRVLQESGARARKEADKWKARFDVIKERFDQKFNAAAPMQT